MQVVRVYTGSDGESHFEDLDLPYEKIADAERTAMQSATGIQFRRTPPGSFSDWHIAPRRQYIITLSGQGEIGLEDGTTHILGPGDVNLAEDTTGKGHTTRVIGDVPRVTATVHLEE